MNTSPKIQLEFKNLPLVEATTRVSFESAIDLKYAIINGVHSQLRDRFPLLTEPTGLEAPPGISKATIAFGPGTIPGAVFAENNQGLTITLQNQVIVARWLKTVGDDGGEYPRFATLRDELWLSVAALRRVSSAEPVRIAVTNMSYVNFLKIPHSEAVLGRYFSDRAQVKATADAKAIHKVEVAWQEPDGLDLRYNLEQVTAQIADEAVEGYRLTTVAGKRLAESDEERAALEQVHDRLQTFFRDLISGSAQDEWKMEEVILD